MNVRKSNYKMTMVRDSVDDVVMYKEICSTILLYCSQQPDPESRYRKQQQLLFNKTESKNHKQQQIAQMIQHFFFILFMFRMLRPKTKIFFYIFILFVHLMYEKETVWVLLLCCCALSCFFVFMRVLLCIQRE